MKRIAIFPGSFDPFTTGHADIVKRALPLFDEIIIGIGVNSNKQRYFSAEQMFERITAAYSETPNVKVEIYTGLTANLARRHGAGFLLRGVRNTTDFEYENSLAHANTHVLPGLETIFMITSPTLIWVTGTIVRDLHRHGSDVSGFLPYELK
ncbi:MAG: pantetheine-phosphate adenylyltransferase [Bacteroidota bacterium]